MINIFNLFLTLFFFWLLFAYASGSISGMCIIFGLLSALLVSIVAWKLKIISKFSGFLFLHLGFYRHFIGVIFSSFVPSLIIAFEAATASKKINPHVYSLPIRKFNNKKSALLISTINLMAGIVFVGLEDGKINICSLGNSYLEHIDLDKIIDNLRKINDNTLA